MTHPNDNTNGPDSGALQTRREQDSTWSPGDGTVSLKALTAEINAQAEAYRNRRRTVFIVGGAIALISVFSLGRLTSLTRGVDPDAMAFVGRMQLQQNLPSGRAALEQAVAAQAPTIVAEAYESLLDMLPAVRERAVDSIHRELDGVNTQFEKSAVAFMRDSLREAKARTDAAYPDADNKFELLAQAAADAFEQRFTEAADEFYPHYAGEMARLQMRLESLVTRADSELTDHERYQRDLITTVLQLVERNRASKI